MFYALQVFTGEEEMIKEHFLPLVMGESDAAYIPTVDLKKKIRGEFKTVTKPLFPGYIIVKTEDAKTLFFKLKEIPEFIKLLRANDFFLAIANDEAGVLLNLGGDEMHIESSKAVVEGDKVEVVSGALVNFTGEITYINRHKRFAKIRIMMFGEEREIKVGLEVIEKRL